MRTLKKKSLSNENLKTQWQEIVFQGMFDSPLFYNVNSTADEIKDNIVTNKKK